MIPQAPPPNWPRPLRRLVKCEELASVFFLAVILIMIAAQVAARYLFRSPITFSEELARFSMIWLAFISATFVLAHRRHLAVDLLSKYLQRRGRIFLECFSSAIILLCSGLLLPSGLQFVQQMSRVKSAALQIPMSWWYLAAFTGFALLALHSIIHLILIFRSPENEVPTPADVPPEIRGAP
jgi:TRAP-type transport system small permease protein